MNRLSSTLIAGWGHAVAAGTLTVLLLAAAPAAAQGVDRAAIEAGRIASPCLTVPDFAAKGATLRQAQQDLAKSRARIRTVERAASPKPAETILRQSAIVEGRVCLVDFVVSDGSLVIVPPVTGLTQNAAAGRLEQAGLRADFREGPASRQAGLVLQQKPEAGAEVRRGERVAVVVSRQLPDKPPAEEDLCRRLPDFAAQGATVQQARQALASMRAHIRTVERTASSKPGETILRQSASTEGTVCLVDFVVSDGSLVIVPPLTGLTPNAASSRLERSGLRADFRDGPQTREPGIVVQQKPEAGAEVRRGERVAAVVSRPLPDRPLPADDLCPRLPDFAAAGATLAQARAELRRHRAELGSVTPQPSTKPAEWVLAQSVQRPSGKPCIVDFTVSDGSLVEVPDLSGLPKAEAEQRLAAVGLAGVLRESPSNNPPGQVFAQRPRGGAEVARGSRVIVEVALPIVRRLPRVVGLGIDDARRQLERWRVDQRPGPSLQAAGTVIEQQPAAGSPLPDGETVVLTVSDGSLDRMPQLIGEPIAAVPARLEGLALQAEQREQESDAPIGQVIEQTPAAGTTVPRASRVQVVVSSGLAVPNVVGRPQDEAGRLLAKFTMAPEVVESARPKGEVIEQRPAAGGRAAAGSTVILRVSDNSIVTVPVLQGLTLEQARRRLQDAGGLSASVAIDQDQPDAIVQSAQPAEGSAVRRGSAVMLVVTVPVRWVPWVIGGIAAVLAAAGWKVWRRRPSGRPSRSSTPAVQADAYATIEFNTAPVEVREGHVELPSISLRAELQHGDAHIRDQEEPPA